MANRDKIQKLKEDWDKGRGCTHEEVMGAIFELDRRLQSIEKRMPDEDMEQLKRTETAIGGE